MKKAVFTFGRMNPPTIGHKKLAEKISSLEGHHFVFLSKTNDHNQNPLTAKDKLYFAHKIFPEVTIMCEEKVSTIFKAIKYLIKQGYDDLTLVVGSDKVKLFKERLYPYVNNENSNDPLILKKLNIVNGGERKKTSSDEVSKISASKIRKLVQNSNKKKFISLYNNVLNSKDMNLLYNTLKKQLK